MNKKKYPVVNIGTTSILTVFVILCMVTFAALSLLTANRNARYNDQVQERTDAYYQAVNQAYQEIAGIDRTLQEYWADGAWEQAEPEYAFIIPIDETSELSVRLTTHEPDAEDASLYTISEFAEISTKEWQGDQSMELLPMDLD